MIVYLFFFFPQNGFDIQSIRRQGYDGARNMCGEWKGLQALFLNDCSYAYYVYCFAHRLQLALVVISREVFLFISSSQNLILLSMWLVLHVNVMINCKMLMKHISYI
jgi:hypothetical protein